VDRDDCTIRILRGTDHHASTVRVHAARRLDGVEDKVEHDLLQLDAVAEDRRQHGIPPAAVDTLHSLRTVTARRRQRGEFCEDGTHMFGEGCRLGGGLVRPRVTAAFRRKHGGGVIMRRYRGLFWLAAWMSAIIVSLARAGDIRSNGPIYNVVHFDVIPLTLDGVDFLQNGYSLLFKYRDQSKIDAGLQSFRVLNLLAPETNHSEIVQVWESYDDYKNHLAQPDTIAFRFDVQGNPALAGGSVVSEAPSMTASTAYYRRSICRGRAAASHRQ
jgi:hypothetical protein